MIKEMCVSPCIIDCERNYTYQTGNWSFVKWPTKGSRVSGRVTAAPQQVADDSCAKLLWESDSRCSPVPLRLPVNIPLPPSPASASLPHSPCLAVPPCRSLCPLPPLTAPLPGCLASPLSCVGSDGYCA